MSKLPEEKAIKSKRVKKAATKKRSSPTPEEQVSADIVIAAEAEFCPYDENLLERARTQWQFGDWESLAQFNRDTLQHHPDRAKLALLAAAGHLQLGDTSAARQFTRLAQEWGCSKKLISQILVAGVHNSLGRAAAASGQEQRAISHFENAIATTTYGSDARLLTHARINQQFAQLGLPTLNLNPLLSADLPSYRVEGGKKKGLFIDCGGYDGCSAIKFLLLNPDYDVVSFEPNPELWKYFEDIPTTLVKKAAYIYDGKIDITIDTVDADGSSLLKGKKIDPTGRVKNEDCPVINVDCIDLSSYVESISGDYEHIILKLDVEGAEYDILEKMLSDNTIKYIDRILCEFHWEKASIAEERHDHLIRSLGDCLVAEEWDALEFGVHGQRQSQLKARHIILESIKSMKLNFQNDSFEKNIK